MLALWFGWSAFFFVLASGCHGNQEKPVSFVAMETVVGDGECSAQITVAIGCGSYLEKLGRADGGRLGGMLRLSFGVPASGIMPPKGPEFQRCSSGYVCGDGCVEIDIRG